LVFAAGSLNNYSGLGWDKTLPPNPNFLGRIRIIIVWVLDVGKENIVVPFLCALLLLIPAIYMPRVKATDSPLVRVVNPITGDRSFDFSTHDKNVGDTFHLYVTVDNVTNLSSWQIALTFDTSLLEFFGGVSILFCQNISLIPEEHIYPFLVNDTVYGGGSAVYNPSFNGSSLLVDLTFRMLQIGQCNLTLQSDTFLLDNSGLEISFTPLNASYRYSDLPSPDVNSDGIVNMMDIALTVSAFNSYSGKSNWNPRCDLNNDGIVNMRDINMVAINFNKRI
jgi:hypothetical protein